MTNIIKKLIKAAVIYSGVLDKKPIWKWTDGDIDRGYTEGAKLVQAVMKKQNEIVKALNND